MMVCRQDDSPRQIYQVLRTQHASFSHAKAIQQVKRKRYPTKPAASRVRPSGGARSAADARPLGARTLTTAACTSSTIISRRRSQDDRSAAHEWHRVLAGERHQFDLPINAQR
jgi:hypothetical protein